MNTRSSSLWSIIWSIIHSKCYWIIVHFGKTITIQILIIQTIWISLIQIHNNYSNISSICWLKKPTLNSRTIKSSMLKLVSFCLINTGKRQTQLWSSWLRITTNLVWIHFCRTKCRLIYKLKLHKRIWTLVALVSQKEIETVIWILFLPLKHKNKLLIWLLN